MASSGLRYVFGLKIMCGQMYFNVHVIIKNKFVNFSLIVLLAVGRRMCSVYTASLALL